MAYIINRFDGTQLTIVDDGVLDISTPLGLIGRNYTGYGETQNENFVFLLENFANNAPPARALRGQIWYNTTEKALKTYNGTAWLSIGNATVAEAEPAHSSGGLWLNSVTNQMYVSDGTTWRLVGPEGVDGFEVTKMTSTKIRDSAGAFKPVILSQINGETTAILTNESFVINPLDSILGFNQLYKGINLKSDSFLIGNVKGNSDSATQLETSRTINDVSFDGTTNIVVTATTNQPLKPGDYIIGSEFNGAVEDIWDIDATPQNLVGKIVARDSTGSFSATNINASEFTGTLLGNVTTISGTSTFNNIVVNDITGNTFSGNSATATKLKLAKTINTVPFDGTDNIILPVPAETLTGNTLAPNIVNSRLTTLGQLESLSVEAPGITVGDGNNMNIKIEGFTPTIESDTTNVLKLKLATGAVTVSSTTLTFLSASAAAADGVLAPAFVPDYTLGTVEDSRPVLGLPSHRWKNIYSKAATLDTLNVTTLSGRTIADQVRVSKDLVVNGIMYGAVTGTLTGAASLNLLKSGDTMTGDLIVGSIEKPSNSLISVRAGDNNRAGFEAHGSNQGTGYLYIGQSTAYGGGVSYNGDSNPSFITGEQADYITFFRRNNGVNSIVFEYPYDGDTVTFKGIVAASTFSGNGASLINLNATQLLTGTVPVARLTGTYNISIAGNVTGNVTGNISGNLTGNTTGTHIGGVVGNVTGAASLNVLKTGDTLTGDINWATTGRGLTWGMNTDGASIRFYNTGDGDAGSRLEFQTTDNGNEYFSWTHAVSGGSTIEAMRLVPNTVSGTSSLRVYGNVTIDGTTTGTFSGTGTSLVTNASNLITGIVPSDRLSGTYNISISGNANYATSAGSAATASAANTATTASFSSRAIVTDSRAAVTTPQTINQSVVFDFKQNSTDGLNDGGLYFGEMTFRPYGSAADWSGGPAHQLGFTSNGNIWHRYGSNTSWNSWRQFLDDSNYTSYTVTKTGTGATGTWPINVSGTAGSVSWTNVTGKPNVVVNDGGTYGINITGSANSASILSGGTSDPSYLRFRGYVSGDAGTNTITGMGMYGINMSGYTDTVIHFGTAGGSSPAIQLRANYSDSLWFRVARDNETNWDGVGSRDQLILHSGNYNSFSPTLTGGNASGTWPINISGQSTTVSSISSSQVITALGYTPVNPLSLSNQSGSAASFSSGAFTGDVTINKVNPTLFLNHTGGFDSGIELAISVQGEDFIIYEPDDGNREWFRINDTGTSGSASVYGQTILDARNYTSYVPTKTGTGASGTWPINITGNALSVSSISSSQVITALGYTPVNPVSLTNQTGTAISGSTGTFTSSISAGDTGKTSNTVITSMAGDSYRAGFEAYGSNQGTGYMYVGQSTVYGGGISYNGDGAPGFIGGETADYVSFFRRNAGTDTVVFDYTYSSNTVRFKGDISVAGTIYGNLTGNVTGNASTVSSVTSGQIASGLGYTPISKSGDLVNGELNLQDNNLKRATIVDYSLAHNALGSVSGGVTVNMELGNYVSVTAVGALTWTFANPPTGARAGSIILELTNGGAYTQYWPASVRWPAGSAPSLAAAGVDVLVFITDDGGSNWRGAISMGDSR